MTEENADNEIKEREGFGTPPGSGTSHTAAMICAALLVVCMILAVVYRDEITVEGILRFTPENLWLAALVFMALYAAKSLTVVVYLKILYVAAGLLFPLPAALAVNLAGTAIELTIPYVIGHVGGRRVAERALERYPKLRRVSELRSRNNLWFSFCTRAVGVIPGDPLSLYFGACGMPYGSFFLGGILGMLPTLLITTVMGVALADPSSPGFIVASSLFVLVQVGTALAFGLWLRQKHRSPRQATEKEGEEYESSQ